MTDYIVLSRLPLPPGSTLDHSLRSEGWHNLTDVVYYRSTELNPAQLATYIKVICQEAKSLSPERVRGAFTIVPLDRRQVESRVATA